MENRGDTDRRMCKRVMGWIVKQAVLQPEDCKTLAQGRIVLLVDHLDEVQHPVPEEEGCGEAVRHPQIEPGESAWKSQVRQLAFERFKSGNHGDA